MLQEADSPQVLSDGVARYSASFDVARYSESTAGFLGLTLPSSLCAASTKRRAEFLAGRFCALQALRRLGWTGMAALDIGPDFTPQWPTGIVGSITHTGTFASAAVTTVATRRSIGIDTETIMSAETMRDTAHRVLSGDGERRLRECMPQLGPEEWLTLLFSAKESIFKCLFPVARVYFEFVDVDIVGLDPEAELFRYRLRRDLSAEFHAGHSGIGRFRISQPYVHTGVELAAVSSGTSCNSFAR